MSKFEVITKNQNQSIIISNEKSHYDAVHVRRINHKPRFGGGKARVLTLEEFKRAERAAMLTRHALRNRALLYMSFSLALRACELRRLRIKDVISEDWELFDEIILLKYMTKDKEQREVYLTNKKTRKVLYQYLDYYKYKIESRRVRNTFNFDDLLFPSQKGGEFLRTDMVRVFRDIFKIAGLKGARSHSGRRTFITSKIDEGVDIKAIADLAGHSDIRTTIGYHQKSPSRLKRIAEKSIF